jgi:hypothetical protein
VSYLPEVTAQATARIEAFVLHCRQRGVTVYLVPPAFPRSHYQVQVPPMSGIIAAMRRSVSAPYLLTLDESALPDELFFDTCYHLTTRGVAERSELLGQRLAQALGRPAGTPDVRQVTHRTAEAASRP